MFFVPIQLHGQTICNQRQTQLVAEDGTIIPPSMCVTLGTNSEKKDHLPAPELEITIEKDSIIEVEKEQDYENKIVEKERVISEKSGKTKNNILSIFILALAYVIYKIRNSY